MTMVTGLLNRLKVNVLVLYGLNLVGLLSLTLRGAFGLMWMGMQSGSQKRGRLRTTVMSGA